MRLILIPLFGLFLAAAPLKAEESPDWTFETIDGTELTLSEEVSEQTTILFFWASWCPYCKALMPHLQSIELEHGDDVEILAIHFRDDNNDPAAFVQEAGYDFTVLASGEEIASLYGVWATPGVLIVDADMQIRFDLRELPARSLPDDVESAGHGRRAAHRAPWWAAEIRSALDIVLTD